MNSSAYGEQCHITKLLSGFVNKLSGLLSLRFQNQTTTMLTLRKYCELILNTKKWIWLVFLMLIQSRTFYSKNLSRNRHSRNSLYLRDIVRNHSIIEVPIQASVMLNEETLTSYLIRCFHFSKLAYAISFRFCWNDPFFFLMYLLPSDCNTPVVS